MKKILAALLFFCFTAINAQITFEKGYFINNSGKKTECYIENLDWHNNPVAFNYKLNETDKESKLENIVGVSEFGIDNVSLYRRFQLNVERSQSASTFIGKNKNPQWKMETLFLYALVTGDASLYSFSDGNITKYFFETKTNPIEQLVYIRYISGNSDGNNYNESIQENNQFKQQLFNNVKCDNMSDGSFKNLEYQKNSLVNHFIAYNNCNGSTAKKSVDYTANEEKLESFALRINPGFYSSSISLTDPNPYYNKSTDLKQASFKIAIDLEFILPFNKGAWSLFANPGYQKFDPSKNFNAPINNPGFGNDGDIVHYTAKIDYSAFEIPIGVRRYFAINKSSKIFANIAYVVVLGKSGSTITFTNSDNLANATDIIPITSRYNFMVGLGYAYKRFSGEIRYNTKRQLSEFRTWDAFYTSIGLNLGFKIL